jgi:hypothetical protein
LILAKKEKKIKSKQRNTKTTYKKENKPKNKEKNIKKQYLRKGPNLSSCTVKSASLTLRNSIAPQITTNHKILNAKVPETEVETLRCHQLTFS